MSDQDTGYIIENDDVIEGEFPAMEPVPVEIMAQRTTREAPDIASCLNIAVPAYPAVVQILPRRPNRFRADIYPKGLTSATMAFDTDPSKLGPNSLQITTAGAFPGPWYSQKPLFASMLVVGSGANTVNVMDTGYSV